MSEEKSKGGRPSKYKPEYCEALIEHMARGLSYEAFAAQCNVCRDTLYEWEKRYPEFFDSKKIGHAKLLKFFEELGFGLMSGDVKGNAAVYIFTMKNKTMSNTYHNIESIINCFFLIHF